MFCYKTKLTDIFEQLK